MYVFVHQHVCKYHGLCKHVPYINMRANIHAKIHACMRPTHAGRNIRSACSDGSTTTNQCGAYVSSGSNFGGAVLAMSGTSVCMCACIRACVYHVDVGLDVYE
jgi:hypothetical protein